MRLITNILFPVDFSASCVAMASYVKRAATLFSAKVSLMYVFDPASHNGFELYLIRGSEEIAEEHQTIRRSVATGSIHSSRQSSPSPNTQESSLPETPRHRSLRSRRMGSISSLCLRMPVFLGGCSLVLQPPRCSMMRIARL